MNVNWNLVLLLFIRQIRCPLNCYLNARSLHKHIDDVRHDLNFTNTDINIFSETRFSSTDNDIMYDIDGYSLFRNDKLSLTLKPFEGMAVFSRVEFLPGYLLSECKWH